MKKFIPLLIAICLVLIGCNQEMTKGDYEEPASTKDRVYRSSWDGNPLMIKQRNDNEDDEIINEIADVAEVNKIIEILKNADWEENVMIDIRPPDYYFSWNSYKHNVWVNKEYKKLELIIEGQSNYVTLPTNSSEILFNTLANKNFEND